MASYTQNFDSLASGTALSTVSGWQNEASAGLTVTNAASNSSPNSVYDTTTSGNGACYTGLGMLTDSTVTFAFQITGSGHARFHLRSSGSSTGSWYEMLVYPATSPTIGIRKRTGGTDGSNFTLTGASATTVASGTWYWGKFSATGSTNVLLQGKVWQVGTSEPAYEVSYTDSSSPLTSGYPGIRIDGAAIYADDFTAATAGLAANGVTFSGTTGTATTVTTTAASGGTSPYTYQFQRAPSSGGVAGTYANVGTAGTALSYSDSGLTAATQYFYRVVVTDSASNTATGAASSVTTTGGALTAQGVTFSGTTASGTTVTTTAASGGTAPYTYQFQRAPDSSGSPGTYANIGTSGTSLSDTDSGLSASTPYWYRVVVTDSASGTATGAGSTVTTASSTITAGTASLTSYTATTASLSSTAASGGAATLTYQWYRSTNPASQGTAISGATGLTLTDTGLATGVPYYYVLSVTDGSTVATTLQIAVIPARTVYVGVIGDSWCTSTCASNSTSASTTTSGAGNVMPARLQALFTDGTMVVGNNQGIGGTNASQWLGGSSYLNTALAAFLSAHSPASDWVVMVHLGINDSSVSYSNPAGGESVSQYQTYLQNITSAILSWGAKAVVLMGPPCILPNSTGNHTPNGVSLLSQYFGALQSIAAASPNAVFAPLSEFDYYVNNQGDLGGDHVHPTPPDGNGAGGATNLATMWAHGLYGVIGPGTRRWTH